MLTLCRVTTGRMACRVIRTVRICTAHQRDSGDAAGGRVRAPVVVRELW
jgi:hypothetical protein